MQTTTLARPAARTLFRLCMLIACAASLAGCQTMSGSSWSLLGNSKGDAETLRSDYAAPEPRQWTDRRDDIINQRATGYGLVHMPAMQRYLDGLLAQIKKQAGVPDWPGSVHVLASSGLDAYATAAGNIYISQSWLSSAESEDEIVALLSHEFGHIYLHYHELDTALDHSNQAATWVAMGVGIATNAAAVSGWTHVDSVTSAYMLGRELAAAAWGRSQESAADLFGLSISLKRGYSYGAGYKTMLERLATWEEQNEKQAAIMREQMRQALKQEAEQGVAAAAEKAKSSLDAALSVPVIHLNFALSSALQLGSDGVSDIWKSTTSKHPETLARLDRLTAAVDLLPPEEVKEEATTTPWLKAQGERRTAQTLKNYQSAIQALQNLESPTAMGLARKAASGPTARHTLPLHALFKAQLAQAGAKKGGRAPSRAGDVLQRNMAAEPDRSWFSYAEYATQLLAQNRKSEAAKVIDMGLSYFGNAPDAWPQAIGFYGQTRGWSAAKQRAEECKRKFARLAQACSNAAASPADIAQQQKASEEKAAAIVKRLFN